MADKKTGIQFANMDAVQGKGFRESTTQAGVPMVQGHFILKSKDVTVGQISIGGFQNGNTVRNTVAVAIGTTGFAHNELKEAIGEAFKKLGLEISEDIPEEGFNGIAVRNLGSRTQNQNPRGQGAYGGGRQPY